MAKAAKIALSLTAVAVAGLALMDGGAVALLNRGNAAAADSERQSPAQPLLTSAPASSVVAAEQVTVATPRPAPTPPPPATTSSYRQGRVLAEAWCSRENLRAAGFRGDSADRAECITGFMAEWET